MENLGKTVVFSSGYGRWGEYRIGGYGWIGVYTVKYSVLLVRRGGVSFPVTMNLVGIFYSTDLA